MHIYGIFRIFKIHKYQNHRLKHPKPKHTISYMNFNYNLVWCGRQDHHQTISKLTCINCHSASPFCISQVAWLQQCVINSQWTSVVIDKWRKQPDICIESSYVFVWDWALNDPLFNLCIQVRRNNKQRRKH
jgi:hypothetical protein